MVRAVQPRECTMHAIAVHGGAGDIPSAELTSEREAAYHAGLERALRAGQAILESSGSSLDAVVAAVQVLEDDPLFNAGRGSVIGAEGICELDASLMEGRELRAGAVTGLRHVRNPILLARLVMERSPHVMLCGSGAEEFALDQGLEPVPNSYFVTQRRQRELDVALQQEHAATESMKGTVGAVAVDDHGNLAAATSTGGMTAKRWGRIGDSPIIGAGTYAANDSCAVSATGHGEFFIRACVAHEIAALVRYAGRTVVEAAEIVVRQQLVRLHGEGGVIAIGRDGTVAMPFNSKGMLRGSIDREGRVATSIF
jgi:beta-aspartyl-peptidase (threonine type)